MFQKIFAVALATLSITAFAAFDEGLSGDLSGDFNNPTAISFSGTSIITGSVGNNGNTGATDGTDADYFSFALSATQSITAINILSSAGDNASFFGYVAGNSFLNQTSPDGFVLFGNGSGDVLAGLIGGPVTGGVHSFWLQETSPVIQNYSIEFVIADSAAVPVPAAFFLFGSALASIGFAKSRTTSGNSSHLS